MTDSGLIGNNESNGRLDLDKSNKLVGVADFSTSFYSLDSGPNPLGHLPSRLLGDSGKKQYYSTIMTCSSRRVYLVQQVFDFLCCIVSPLLSTVAYSAFGI